MYNPTDILAFDIDSDEKKLKPEKIQDNFENISHETKQISDIIVKNEKFATQSRKEIDDSVQSYRKQFMDI